MILVTGNQGYIGTVLCERLINEGCDIKGLDIGYFDECLLKPEKYKIKQIKKDIRDLDFDDLGNSLIHRPKDQSKFVNKLIFFFESNFPLFFYLTKNIAIKSLFKKKN